MKIEQHLIDSANSLDTILWENIDATNAQKMHSNISFGKALIQERDWPLIGLSHLEAIALFVLANTDEAVKELYFYALQRRSLYVQKATERLIQIMTTGRTDPLSDIEKLDCDTAFHSIYINICGLFDAFSVLFYFYEYREIKQNLSVDFTKKAFRDKLKQKKLDKLVGCHEEWISYLKNDIRHKIIHQIPPYIPPCYMTKDERTAHDHLEELKWQALSNGNIETAKDYELAQSKLGRFSPHVAFTELDNKNGKMDICTILNDVIRAQKFVTECSIILNEVRLANNSI